MTDERPRRRVRCYPFEVVRDGDRLRLKLPPDVDQDEVFGPDDPLRKLFEPAGDTDQQQPHGG